MYVSEYARVPPDAAATMMLTVRLLNSTSATTSFWAGVARVWGTLESPRFGREGSYIIDLAAIRSNDSEMVTRELAEQLLNNLTRPVTRPQATILEL